MRLCNLVTVKSWKQLSTKHVSYVDFFLKDKPTSSKMFLEENHINK